MKLTISFSGIMVPIELAQICSPAAAVVYAVLHSATDENDIAHLSNNEIGKRAGVPGRSVPAIISKLAALGIVERHYNSGSATSYYVKDILPAEQPEPERVRAATPAEVPAEHEEPARQSEQHLPRVPTAPKYNFPYYVMLSTIGSTLANDYPLSELEVDAITDERETEECTIPSDWAFSDNQKMIEDALKYLAYFSNLKEGQLKDMKEDVIIALTEAICTGRKSAVHGADPYLIISRLNTIIHNPDINLGQWLDNFAKMFSEKFNSETQKIYNYHAYLKTAAINYLTEYKAEIYNGFYEDE